MVAKLEAVDSLLSITDLMALQLAAKPLERLRDHVPESCTVNIAKQFEVIGIVSTGTSSTRRVPGSALNALAWLLAVCEPHHKLALRMLLRDMPSSEAVAEAKELLDSVGTDTVVRPAVRGAVLAEVIA